VSRQRRLVLVDGRALIIIVDNIVAVETSSGYPAWLQFHRHAREWSGPGLTHDDGASI
jgi:hypothetical protein